METKDIQKIDTYLKYYNNSIINKLFLDDGISIRFSQPWILNDPLEFNPIIKINQTDEYARYIINGITLPSLNEWIRIQTIENKINEFGVLSLTKNSLSFDMWNLYGNGHKGFLIEFKQNFNEHNTLKSDDGQVYPIVKVTYVQKYSIDISMISNSEGVFLDKDINEYLFYNKTNRWDYEQEYRLVKPLSDFGKKFQPKVDYRHDGLHTRILPYDYIETITFGANMKKTDKIKIFKKLRNTNVKFNQSFIIKDEKGIDGNWGKVVIGAIKNSEIPKYKFLSPQVFSCEKESIDNAKDIVIKELNELPYYNDIYKHLVDQTYKNNLDLRLES